MTNKENHKRLWEWLAANPDKEKSHWPEWNTNGGKRKIPPAWCYACLEAQKDASVDDDLDNRCNYCPIESWGGEGLIYCEENDLVKYTVFEKWSLDKDELTAYDRCFFALLIADLWE